LTLFPKSGRLFGGKIRSKIVEDSICDRQGTGNQSPITGASVYEKAFNLSSDLRRERPRISQNSSQLSGDVLRAALPENAALIFPPSARAGETAGLSADEAARTGAEMSL
jgi:hypothetical protein